MWFRFVEQMRGTKKPINTAKKVKASTGSKDFTFNDLSKTTMNFHGTKLAV